MFICFNFHGLSMFHNILITNLRVTLTILDASVYELYRYFKKVLLYIHGDKPNLVLGVGCWHIKFLAYWQAYMVSCCLLFSKTNFLLKCGSREQRRCNSPQQPGKWGNIKQQQQLSFIPGIGYSFFLGSNIPLDCGYDAIPGIYLPFPISQACEYQCRPCPLQHAFVKHSSSQRGKKCMQPRQ